MTNSEAVEHLESVSSLYLREILHLGEHSLKLVVEQALNSANSASDSPAVILSRPGTPAKPGCQRFELCWPSYVAYLVTEEPAGSSAHRGYSDESYTGQRLRLYSKSHFLEHIAREIGGHPATVLHYKLVCLNYRVDVAAYAPPEVCLLAPDAGRERQNKRPASRQIGGIIGPY